MKIISKCLIATVFIGLTFLQNVYAIDKPQPILEAEYVFTIEATIDAPIAMGETIDGSRLSIPITGGKFYGKKIKGTVLPGGADYQVQRSDGSTMLHAVYMIQTDDGALINVVNDGLIIPPAEGQEFYFRTSPKFTAPNGKYSWLNKSIFVCGARFDSDIPGTVFIDVYKLN